MPLTQFTRREYSTAEDKFERCVRKCIIFPADGSAIRTANMTVEAAPAAADISALRKFNRCVDMTSAYGAEHRNSQTRIMVYDEPNTSYRPAYIVFCNRSLRLPINLTIAKLVGVTPSVLQSKKRLFWRGDVVAMKVRWTPGKKFGAVDVLDAHVSELGSLELEFLRTQYHQGFWERELRCDEIECK